MRGYNFNVHNIDIMLCNVYMPTDTTYDQENVYTFNDVLNDIERVWSMTVIKLF